MRFNIIIMGERRGTRGLELWCKRMTEGYPGVKVDNMTTSWRDGLAFCAIIHHFRPDLIEFSKLDKNDIYYNNKLAFRVAEDHLGIPALLEPEDMVEYSVPDRLSILTYLSQFYQAFAVNQSHSQIKTPAKRPPPTDLQMHMVSGTSSTPPKKVALRISGARRDPCAKCGLPVFIAERLNVGEALYHRTCFRCARCDSQLTLVNYYETENGEFCCETCPDEEKPTRSSVNILRKSLSDEEKSASLKGESDIFSSNFENALEDPKDDSLRHNFTLNKVTGAAYMRARAEFMTTQVDTSNSDSDSDSSRKREPPDLPMTQIPQIVHKDDAHVENMDADGINMLPSFSDSNPPSCKPKDQTSDRTVFESQDAVTKDSISARDGPALSSIKSRIKLFEDNVVHHEIFKSDVNRESLRLSPENIKVPYAESAKELDARHYSNGNQVGNSFNHSKNEKVIGSRLSEEAGITAIDDSYKFYESAMSENYQGDVSDLRDTSMLSEQNESVIECPEIASENDYENCGSSESKIKSAQLSEPNESIITISSESAFEHEKVLSISFESDENPALRSEQSESIIVVSSETSSEYNNEIRPSSEKERSDIEQQPENRNSFVVVSDTSEQNVEAHSQPSDTNEKPQQETVSASVPLHSKPEHLGNLNPFDIDEEEEIEEKSIVKTSKSVSLNPFGDSDEEENEQVHETSKSTSLNPFGDTDDEEEDKQAEIKKPAPAPRRIVSPRSMNPFDSDDENIETAEQVPAQPPKPAVRKLIKVDKISLAPYWKDDVSPVPKTRSPLKNTSDTLSLTGSGRKKKPAPKPPTAASCFNHDANESALSSLNSSPSQSVCHSPKPTAKARKIRKAPPPPSSSTPLKTEASNFALPVSPIIHEDMGSKPLLFRVGSEENLKSAKDELNRNRQHNSSFSPNEGPSSLPNKSTYGKWKKRKGQAPVRPIPTRRSIKNLPIDEIKSELELIEVQQLGLEKQGVMLEKLIRDRSEVPGTSEDEILAPETQDMIIQLFDLVNEKNELFRKQAELMYLRRQHRLEEEYAEVEYQIRCLMLQPESNKTDSDKEKEDELINRLVDIVERRNQIVDCLEMDRQRAADEDNSIISEMSLFKKKREDSSTTKKKSNKKDKTKLKKDKDKKSKSKIKMDVDKDIDETETSSSKEKKKKKFALF